MLKDCPLRGPSGPDAHSRPVRRNNNPPNVRAVSPARALGLGRAGGTGGGRGKAAFAGQSLPLGGPACPRTTLRNIPHTLAVSGKRAHGPCRVAFLRDHSLRVRATHFLYPFLPLSTPRLNPRPPIAMLPDQTAGDSEGALEPPGSDRRARDCPWLCGTHPGCRN